LFHAGRRGHPEKWAGHPGFLRGWYAKETSIQLRALVSASDPDKLWTLRCEVREALISYVRFPKYYQFLQHNTVNPTKRVAQRDSRRGARDRYEGQPAGRLESRVEHFSGRRHCVEREMSSYRVEYRRDHGSEGRVQTPGSSALAILR
jgi:hypothetical protein